MLSWAGREAVCNGIAVLEGEGFVSEMCEWKGNVTGRCMDDANYQELLIATFSARNHEIESAAVRNYIYHSRCLGS